MKKSYSFFYSSGQEWYSMYFEVPIAEGIYSWYHHKPWSEGTVVFDGPFITRESKVYAIANTRGVIATFLSTDTQDFGYGIFPYLKTVPFVLSEVMIAQIHHWFLAMSDVICTSGTFSCKLTVGSNTQSYAGMVDSGTTSTKGFHRRGVLQGGDRGRTVQIELNSEVEAGKGLFSSLTINQIGFEYELKPFVGDKTITS